jgi:hypothetical protein
MANLGSKIALFAERQGVATSYRDDEPSGFSTTRRPWRPHSNIDANIFKKSAKGTWQAEKRPA